jgi:integrase
MKERTGYIYYDKSRKRFVGRVTFTDSVTGKRKEKKCYGKTKTETRRKLTKLKQKFDHHGTQVVVNERMTFAQLAEEYRKKKLVPAVFVNGKKIAGLKNPNTPSIYLDVLIEHFGKKRIDAIEHSHIEDFKLLRMQTPTKYKGRRAIASVHHELEVLRRVLNYAVRNRKLAHSPFKADNTGTPLIQKQHETKRERIPTFGEEMALVEVCNHPGSRVADVIIIAADTGLRRNEMLTLAWREDVDFAARTVSVRPENSKNGKPRSVPMTERVHDRLCELFKVYGDHPTGLVFGGLRDPKKAFGTGCEKKKIEDLRLHDFRHAFVTRAILAGIPPAVVLKASGHSSEEWKRYLNVTPEVLRGLFNPLKDQDAALVRAYGLDVLRQLTEALGFVWRGGEEWSPAAQIQFDALAAAAGEQIN